jgi:N-methylhydantoinase B/oxoprolinase/acetone carboxylase alpha subunit
VEEYGLETVQEYMHHIRCNAEQSVRDLLRNVVQKTGRNVLSAVDYLDDGSPVRLSVTAFKLYAVQFGMDEKLTFISPPRGGLACARFDRSNSG